MEKRLLGKTGLLVSAVVYGGIVSMSEEQPHSDGYVSWALEQGVNYFDVAPTYGNAQLILGNSLQQHGRDRFYLACKTQERQKDKAQAELEASLRLLHTDYFDVYQMHALHSVEEVETAFAPGGVMELMLWAKQRGYVRNLGITCHSERAALKAISLYDFDTLLFPTNWMLHMGQNFGAAATQTAKSHGMGLLGMKSLVQRAWNDEAERKNSDFPKSWCKPFDKTDEALRVAAMKYALSLGVDALVPPGNYFDFHFAVEHIDQCVQNPLNEQDKALLGQAYEKVAAQPFFEADL